MPGRRPADAARGDGTPEALSASDLQRCLKAQQSLIKLDAQLTMHFFHIEAPQDCVCPSLDARRESLERLEFDYFGQDGYFIDAQPFRGRWWAEYIEHKLHEESAICRRCIDKTAVAQLELQEVEWFHLPSTLGLEVGDDNWEG